MDINNVPCLVRHQESCTDSKGAVNRCGFMKQRLYYHPDMATNVSQHGCVTMPRDNSAFMQLSTREEPGTEKIYVKEENVKLEVPEDNDENEPVQENRGECAPEEETSYLPEDLSHVKQEPLPTDEADENIYITVESVDCFKCEFERNATKLLVPVLPKTEPVVDATCDAPESTGLLQSTERCDFPFEESVSHGVSHSESEIGSEGSTHITIFCAEEKEDVEQEEEEEEEIENLSAPQLKFSLRENKYQIFSCSFCLQNFSSKYRLINHVFVHIDGVQPPECVCRSCGEVFLSYASLKKHLKISDTAQDSSANKEEIYNYGGEHGSSFLPDDQEDAGVHQTERQCLSIETGKSFTDKHNLNITIHSAENRDRNDNNGTSNTTGKVDIDTVPHLGKRSHNCDVCGKSFTTLSKLKTHKFIHTGTKLHKCDICGKSFTHLQSLKRHGFMHIATKSHKCDICGKTFMWSCHLKIHGRVHTGERPHKCEICGKTFTQLGNLNIHRFIHTGTKRHKCDVCDKSYALLRTLKKHSLIHL